MADHDFRKDESVELEEGKSDHKLSSTLEASTMSFTPSPSSISSSSPLDDRLATPPSPTPLDRHPTSYPRGNSPKKPREEFTAVPFGRDEGPSAPLVAQTGLVPTTTPVVHAVGEQDRPPPLEDPKDSKRKVNSPRRPRRPVALTSTAGAASAAAAVNLPPTRSRVIVAPVAAPPGPGADPLPDPAACSQLSRTVLINQLEQRLGGHTSTNFTAQSLNRTVNFRVENHSLHDWRLDHFSKSRGRLDYQFDDDHGETLAAFDKHLQIENFAIFKGSKTRHVPAGTQFYLRFVDDASAPPVAIHCLVGVNFWVSNVLMVVINQQTDAPNDCSDFYSAHKANSSECKFGDSRFNTPVTHGVRVEARLTNESSATGWLYIY